MSPFGRRIRKLFGSVPLRPPGARPEAEFVALIVLVGAIEECRSAVRKYQS